MGSKSRIIEFAGAQANANANAALRAKSIYNLTSVKEKIWILGSGESWFCCAWLLVRTPHVLRGLRRILLRGFYCCYVYCQTRKGAHHYGCLETVWKSETMDVTVSIVEP